MQATAGKRPAGQNTPARWPRLEAALGLLWRWRGVLEAEWGRRLWGGRLPHRWAHERGGAVLLRAAGHLVRVRVRVRVSGQGQG